jgi:hypothetical protein
MGQLQRKPEKPFYQKRILPWEEKLRLDSFLVWDGGYRWFQSANVIPLERYRDVTVIRRIKANILDRLRGYGFVSPKRPTGKPKLAVRN